MVMPTGQAWPFVYDPGLVRAELPPLPSSYATGRRRGRRLMFRKILNVLSNHIGAVPNPISKGTQQAGARIRGASVTNSICPYCAVGCAQLVYVKGGKIVDIEGSYDSPINGGTLCPKGAATYQLTVNPHRLTRVKYRAPFSDRWEERPLEWA